MWDIQINYKLNGNDYTLSTMERIFRITKNKQFIHVQLMRVSDRKACLNIGLKDINEVVGNFKEYIIFCERTKVFDEVSFWDDEWAKHTKVFARFLYRTEDGEIMGFNEQVGSVQGVMRSNSACKLIDEKYIPFVLNRTLSELDQIRNVGPFKEYTLDEIVELSNHNLGEDTYRKLNN